MTVDQVRPVLISGAAPLTKAEQVRVIGEVTGIPWHFEETDREDARETMLNDGWPPGIVEGVLDAQAAMASAPHPFNSTVEEVSGAPARGFRDWVADYADLFTRDDQEAN